jgi:predicted branched-subunit amino acid permease
MGIGPFGLIYGAAAKAAGLGLGQTALMSLTVFAGSSQLVFVGLWQDGANALALALTVALVNLRLLVYGSSLAPFLGRGEGLALRALRSYALTDESYALSLPSLLRPGFALRRTPFYLGCAFPTWLGWQLTGALGFLAGAALPESVPLRMAVPLVFLSLLISVLRAGTARPTPKAAAALASGLSALALAPLPHGLGLVMAILIGAACGALATRAGGRGCGGPGPAPGGAAGGKG